MKNFMNIELDQRFGEEAKAERKITHSVLQFIQEIEARSLHLSFGYESLAQYLIQRHHYSEGAAYRRIGAMRMLSAVPEASEKILDGSLNLSQLSMAQSAVYQKQKKDQKKVSKVEKQNLLKDLEKKSTGQTKVELAKALDFEPAQKKPVTYGRDETIFLNLKFSKEEFALINESLIHLSHQTNDLKELFVILCKKELRHRKSKQQERDLKRGEERQNGKNQHVNQDMRNQDVNVNLEMKSQDVNVNHDVQDVKDIENPDEKSASKTTQGDFAAKSGRSRYIKMEIRRQIFSRDESGCRFVGEDGHVCGSLVRLQLDHLQAFAKGGSHAVENLQLLCQAHNLFKAEQEGLGRPR